MRRKLRPFLPVVLLVVSLTACGSQIGAGGVPDGTAELVVLDYLDENNMDASDYNSYSFEVAHNYDKSANADAAIINLKIEYNYASESVRKPKHSCVVYL